jgi:hypothetical protein
MGDDAGVAKPRKFVQQHQDGNGVAIRRRQLTHVEIDQLLQKEVIERGDAREVVGRPAR